jgi:hypothetical protein
MPSEAATSYFHQGSTISYPIHVVIDLRIPCKGNIEGASGYFLLAEHKAGIKFICYTNFGPKMMPPLNCDIFKKPRNPSLMMRTLSFAKIEWKDLPLLLHIFTVKTIFINLRTKIPIIMLFAVRL